MARTQRETLAGAGRRGSGAPLSTEEHGANAGGGQSLAECLGLGGRLGWLSTDTIGGTRYGNHLAGCEIKAETAGRCASTTGGCCHQGRRGAFRDECGIQRKGGQCEDRRRLD